MLPEEEAPARGVPRAAAETVLPNMAATPSITMLSISISGSSAREGGGRSAGGGGDGGLRDGASAFLELEKYLL